MQRPATQIRDRLLAGLDKDYNVRGLRRIAGNFSVSVATRGREGAVRGGPGGLAGGGGGGRGGPGGRGGGGGAPGEPRGVGEDHWEASGRYRMAAEVAALCRRPSFFWCRPVFAVKGVR